MIEDILHPSSSSTSTKVTVSASTTTGNSPDKLKGGNTMGSNSPRSGMVHTNGVNVSVANLDLDTLEKLCKHSHHTILLL